MTKEEKLQSIIANLNAHPENLNIILKAAVLKALPNVEEIQLDNIMILLGL